MKPFHYRNLGSMATVGRNRAVAEFSQSENARMVCLGDGLRLVVHLRSISLKACNKVGGLLNCLNYFYIRSVYAYDSLCP